MSSETSFHEVENVWENITDTAQLQSLVKKFAGHTIRAEALILDIHNELYYGDIYSWDNGSPCWEQMRGMAKNFPEKVSEH